MEKCRGVCLYVCELCMTSYIYFLMVRSYNVNHVISSHHNSCNASYLILLFDR